MNNRDVLYITTRLTLLHLPDKDLLMVIRVRIVELLNYYVRCATVTPGLRRGEANVCVVTPAAGRCYLRTGIETLLSIDGVYYLRIGMVSTEETCGRFTIELPHEADDGSRRVVVDKSELIAFARL